MASFTLTVLVIFVLGTVVILFARGPRAANIDGIGAAPARPYIARTADIVRTVERPGRDAINDEGAAQRRAAPPDVPMAPPPKPPRRPAPKAKKRVAAKKRVHKGKART